MYNECRHLFTSGTKCRQAALKEQPFCTYHRNTRQRPSPSNTPYDPHGDPEHFVLNLPVCDDPDSIQLAISDVVVHLAADMLDSKRAKILLYGLQVSSQHYRGTKGKQVKGEKETELKQDVVREVYTHTDGTQIGPEVQTPDPEDIPKKRPPSLGRFLLEKAVETGFVTDPEAKKMLEDDTYYSPGSLDIKAVAEEKEERKSAPPQKRHPERQISGFHSERSVRKHAQSKNPHELEEPALSLSNGSWEVGQRPTGCTSRRINRWQPNTLRIGHPDPECNEGEGSIHSIEPHNIRQLSATNIQTSPNPKDRYRKATRKTPR